MDVEQEIIRARLANAAKLAEKDAAAAADVLESLHMQVFFTSRLDRLGAALAANAAAKTALEARRLEEVDAPAARAEQLRAEAAAVAAEAEAEKTRALSRVFVTSEYRLAQALEEETARRVKLASRHSNLPDPEEPESPAPEVPLNGGKAHAPRW